MAGYRGPVTTLRGAAAGAKTRDQAPADHRRLTAAGTGWQMVCGLRTMVWGVRTMVCELKTLAYSPGSKNGGLAVEGAKVTSAMDDVIA